MLTPEEVNFIRTVARHSAQNGVTFIQTMNSGLHIQFVGDDRIVRHDDAEATWTAIVTPNKDAMVEKGLLTVSVNPSGLIPTYTLTEEALRLVQFTD